MRIITILAVFFAFTMILPAQFQDLTEPEKKVEIKKKDDGSIVPPKNNDEGLAFKKDKYYMETDAFFEDVWNAVIETLKSDNCELITKVQKQNDEGFFKGVFKSEFCLFTTIEDDEIVAELERYSYKVPVIRGGVWETGRVQYKIIINEIDGGEKTSVLVKAEISGAETNVTNEVHFWESNGYYETNLLSRVEYKLNNM